MAEFDFDRAIHLTRILRMPSQKIFTFGETHFFYWIISGQANESIVRSGKLSCSKPSIITPEMLSKNFSGFSNESISFAENHFQKILKKLRLLGYQFKNELINEVKLSIHIEHLRDNLEKKIPADTLDQVLIQVPVDIWQIALVKISMELIKKSFVMNFEDLEDHGYFLSKEEQRKKEIEFLFAEAQQEPTYIQELGAKLQEYGMFAVYEDRFFQLVQSKKER